MNEYCKYCNDATSHTVYTMEKGPHYAKLVCDECGGMTRWMKKPKNENKRPKNKYTPSDLERNSCIICMREKDELINSEILEVHHIIEIANGGPDTPDNIDVVCTPCHRMIHYQRKYLRRASGNYA